MKSGPGDIFGTLVDRFRSPPQPCGKLIQDLLPGVERLGRGVDHPPLTRAEVKKRVELYLFSFSGPSSPVTGRFFYFYFVAFLMFLLLGFFLWMSFYSFVIDNELYNNTQGASENLCVCVYTNTHLNFHFSTYIYM